MKLEFSGFAMTTANNPSNNLSPWKPGSSRKVVVVSGGQVVTELRQ